MIPAGQNRYEIKRKRIIRCAFGCPVSIKFSANVRFGSNAEVKTLHFDARFTPESGHQEWYETVPDYRKGDGKMMSSPKNAFVATLHRDHGEAIVLIDRGVATMVGQEESTYLQSLIVGYMPASSIHVAAEIGLADIIHDGKVTADAISDASGLERNRGFRLLRYLVALGILETDGTQYSLTAVGDLLRSDVPRINARSGTAAQASVSGFCRS